jgi:hypothetical protein
MTPVTIDIRDVFPQELTLGMRGPAVLRLESHAPRWEEGPIPDLGLLFRRAAEAGLFAGRFAPPWSAQAMVIGTEADLSVPSASWTMKLAGIDPGAFRIMWNVLQRLELEEAAITTSIDPMRTGAGKKRLDVGQLPYPGVHDAPPFTLDVEPPVRTSRDRFVQIVFERPPEDAVVDAVLATFEVWTNLLLLGGYAEDNEAQSGVFPDSPMQYDELTVQQAFPEVFAADEAAFGAIVNHAAAIHLRGQKVAAVVIR